MIILEGHCPFYRGSFLFYLAGNFPPSLTVMNSLALGADSAELPWLITVLVLTTAPSSCSNEKNLSYLFQSWESSRSGEVQVCNGLAADPTWPLDPWSCAVMDSATALCFCYSDFCLGLCCETLGFKVCECVCKPPVCCRVFLTRAVRLDGSGAEHCPKAGKSQLGVPCHGELSPGCVSPGPGEGSAWPRCLQHPWEVPGRGEPLFCSLWEPFLVLLSIKVCVMLQTVLICCLSSWITWLKVAPVQFFWLLSWLLDTWMWHALLLLVNKKSKLKKKRSSIHFSRKTQLLESGDCRVSNAPFTPTPSSPKRTGKPSWTHLW